MSEFYFSNNGHLLMKIVRNVCTGKYIMHVLCQKVLQSFVVLLLHIKVRRRQQ